MDKNFDERLSKLENTLAGIERFINEFKNPINNNADNTDIKENYERTKAENAEINNDKDIDSQNRVALNKTESNTTKINTYFSKQCHDEIQPVHNDIATAETNTQLSNNEKNVDDIIKNSDVKDMNLENLSIEFAVKNIDIKLISEDQDNIDRVETSENESADSKDLIQDTVNYAELNRRLISIELLLKEISISLQNLKPKGFYRNWEASHQVILSSSFVPKDVFTNVLWRMSRQMENFYTGESSVNRLFDSLTTYRVSRSTRFPSKGVYVDLNDYDIYNQCQRIREAAYTCGSKCNTVSTDVFKTALAYLHNLVLCDLHDPKVTGMMYDLQGFEKEHGLEWYEG